MKLLKIVWAATVLAALCLLPAAVQAQFTFTTNNGAITITGCYWSGNVVIPSSTNGYPVVNIGDNAFNYAPIQNIVTNVTIPDSVTNIGNKSFYGCHQITNVIIGGNVASIGSDAFGGCSSLQSITIPTNVVSLGTWAFESCGLQAAYFLGNAPSGPANIFNNNANGFVVLHLPGTTGWGNTFGGSPALLWDISDQCGYTTNNNAVSFGRYLGAGTTVNVPSTINNLPVKSIGTNAFAYLTTLTNVVLPNGVTNIGDYAFYNCYNFPSITIPTNVTRIGSYAFYNTFYSSSGLTPLTIPSSVTSIGSYAFNDDNASLPAVCFQGNAPSGDSTIIGDSSTVVCYLPGATGWGSTFSGSRTMLWDTQDQLGYSTNNNTSTIGRYLGFSSAVTLPDTINGMPVTSIGSNAFISCSSLVNVIVPSSVTNLGISAFGSCSHLLNMGFLGNAPAVGTNVFAGSAPYIYYQPGATGWGSSLGGRPVVLWDTLDQLGYTTNGSYATIAHCFGATGVVNIPSSINGLPVTVIGTNAFASLTTFTNVNIPNSITNIGNRAFSSCSSLSACAIPNSVTSIGNYAFYSCSGLTMIAIPNSVMSFGTNIFYYCTNLTYVTLPSSLTGIPNNMFNGCSSLTNIIIPSGVTNIGALAFNGCSLLAGVIIPSSVTSIGDHAFGNIHALTNIYFLGNAPSGGNLNIFYNQNPTVYYLPGTIGWGSSFGLWGHTKLWLPQMQTGDGRFGVQTNGFGFNLNWASGQTVVVEASTNLINWTPVSTNTITGGTATFSDPQWTNYPGRFYRLRSP